jgi:hypothetical protein
MTRRCEDTDTSGLEPKPSPTSGNRVHYVKVGEMRSEGDTNTCLRPLGLCELGGSCDSCWYRPDHPRFKK